ncbi:MAG: hypothetical protein M3Z09_14790 [Acidobacteriota bacterium]|nr:hypothetical protein [Acidobacteriota bacterium]
MWRAARMWLLLAGFGAPFAAALGAQSLAARLDSANVLHISAPRFHFLTGKPLERLKDGATVAFLGQLSLSFDANTTVQARSVARFAMSYDIWEERFSVTRFSLSKGETAARTASHLSGDAAENWCLDNLGLDSSLIPADRQFWLRLELRVEENRDTNGVLGDPGINLTRLIEIFSRPARAQQPRWQLDAGPLRLRDLRRNS